MYFRLLLPSMARSVAQAQMEQYRLVDVYQRQPLYLAATPDRLTRARAVTPRLAHVAYRLGPGSELLAAPLPPALRGGLMVLSDWDCPPVEEPDRLARQIARTCLRRGYAGAAADFDPPARPDRLALLEALSPLLAS